MQNACRTCLGLSKKMINIFDHFGNNKLISDTIIECTNIKVHKNDGLPTNICICCLEKLKAASDFRILVLESDIKLRNHCDIILKDNFRKDNDFSLVKEDYLEEQTNNCEANKKEVTDTNSLVAIHENKAVTVCKVEYSNEITENIKQEFISDLHNRSILTNSHVFDHEEHIDEQINLIANETGKNVSSLRVRKETNLVAHNADLALMRANKRKKSVFCKECNRSFGYCYFKIHVRNHNGDRPFKCDVCNKGFAKEFLLKTHKATHLDNRPYSCEVCGKGFKNLIALRGHMLRHQKDRPFVCEVCGKGFVDGSGLADHKVAHRTEKNYACSTCGKMFLSKGRMTRHSKKHSDDRPHVCSYCGRQFKDKTVLQKHILIHTGEKPFTCKICSKQFRQGSVLTLHMRIHTGETPYPCHLCPCKFKYSHHLQNHMKVHKSV